LLETEKQRRWWFATHPEFSSHRSGVAGGGDDDQGSDKVPPEDVDAYVDEALKYQADSRIIELLKLIKFWFGTEFESKTPAEKHALLWGDDVDGSTTLDLTNSDAQGPSLEQNEAKPESNGPLTSDQGLQDGREWALDPDRGPGPPLVLNPDYLSGFYQGAEEAQRDYKKGWEIGYLSIHTGKRPPDLDPEDDSAYAQGVKEGATVALDERERWEQIWQDPVPFSLGNRHSRALRKSMEKAGDQRQSPDEDAHHIVPWRHWRAERARDILKDHGIDIDAAENGAWVNRTFHWTLSNSTRYMDTVTRRLEKAGSREEALQVLGRIRDQLSRGKFPR
jgi:A nuclease family of the HNH/ENDO VII superfamily with conserved AHH